MLGLLGSTSVLAVGQWGVCSRSCMHLCASAVGYDRSRAASAACPAGLHRVPGPLHTQTLDVLWPTRPEVLLPLPRPGTTVIRDDFNQSGPIPPSEVPPTEGQLNSTIWTGFRQWTAGPYNWSACATQQYGGTDSYVLMINTMAWVQMQPFTFPPNATVSFYAIACGSSDEVPINVSYANEDEQPWQEVWSVAPAHDEWRRYEFRLPFANDTYASLRWGKPSRDQTVGVYVDRLVMLLVCVLACVGLRSSHVRRYGAIVVKWS